MANHTLGPWSYLSPARTGGQPQIVAYGGLGTVCYPNTGKEEDYLLIAAAPELLAACEETATAIHTYQERGSHKDREDLNRCWQTIRLAIAKATHHTGD